MCWTGRKEPKIADHDIPVFKIVQMSEDKQLIVSHYYRKRWTMGELHKGVCMNHYKASLWSTRPVDASLITIEGGLHSYNPDKVSLKAHQVYNQVDVVSNAPTLLSKGNTLDIFSLDKMFKREYKEHFSLARMDCIIPKGKEYYENEKGEIVSQVLIPLTCKKIIREITLNYE